MENEITKFDDINKLLVELSTRLRETLKNNLFGLYLTGSLTYGDFDYGSSDVDFLVITKDKLTKKELDAVGIMHRDIAFKFPYWSKRLEGSYITLNMLKDSSNKPKEKRPYFNAGKFNEFPYGNEWFINLFALEKYGKVLFGPNPKVVFPHISIEQVRKASKYNLFEEWIPELKKRSLFVDPFYDSEHLKTYAVLTMCRILYGAVNRDIPTKRKSADWVIKKYSDWSSLVKKAKNWQHGQKLSDTKEVEEFIKFTANMIND